MTLASQKPPAPTTRVREQGARSREKILDAAESLMASHGYAGASISAICRESGLPASSVYWHFENKQGLLRAVMERGADRMTAEVRAAYDEPGTARERLRRTLQRAAVVFMEQPREFQRLEMIITLEQGASDEVWRSASDRFRAHLEELLEEALYEVFRPVDPAAARSIAAEGTRFAQILGNGATFEAIRNPDSFDPSALVEQLEIALLALGDVALAPQGAMENES